MRRLSLPTDGTRQEAFQTLDAGASTGHAALREKKKRIKLGVTEVINAVDSFHGIYMAFSLKYHQYQLIRCWNWNILGEAGQYHGCWCPGSSHHQTSSNQVITNMQDKQVLSSMRKDFNHLHHLSVEKWWKMWMFLCFVKIDSVQINDLDGFVANYVSSWQQVSHNLNHSTLNLI